MEGFREVVLKANDFISRQGKKERAYVGVRKNGEHSSSLPNKDGYVTLRI
jgi:hypothetical protein